MDPENPLKSIILAFHLNEIERKGKHFAKLAARWRKDYPKDENQREAEYRAAASTTIAVVVIVIIVIRIIIFLTKPTPLLLLLL